MKVTEIRREADLAPLETAWNELLRSSGSNTIFLTWEWVTSWWAAYGNPGELRVLTVSDASGVLRGIAPLRVQAVRKYGQTVNAPAFIGDSSIDGSPSDSDYLDFITAPGYEKEVVEAVYRYCAETLGGGAVLLLNEIPAASPNLAALRETAGARGMAWRETDVGCATVRLPETWDEYLRMLQPRFRTKVRSVLRNLEGRPEVRFRFCEDAGELERVLPSLFDLHTRRWAEEGKRGVFYWDRKRRFYFELSRVLLDRGWLRLSLLEWNGRILACQYGFAYNGTYFQLQEGYEPASEHWNLGIGLRAWSIREFLKQGLREYDFLGGVGRHKTTWAAEINLSKRIVIAPKSYRNLMFRRGPEWDAAGRELVRKVVPEKVLAARRARLENTSAANSGGNTEWVRRAAAACYFHSGLPSVARHLRERYQLSITTNGHGRKISWGPRQEGSARILYYHRINDENDPFFDATPTALFEAHMRYLARHYKVVSAGELMQCLEEGCEPAESVVAITFDDGYEDNYRNAFPILRRYGLPATIFLTTGTIDSGEPLWFEELAEAVKTTAQEYIDVEADVPRRFWLRSQVERIAASGQIFGVLRRLEDGARRERLAGILRELGFQRGARRSAMLTWDQIREMQANGIDFGGHTVTHPFLSKLTPAQASWEISECKRRIEEQIQQPADYFAYPNGREEDFTPENKELLRAAGYRGAMTTIWGLNGRSTDRMELRRGGPWEPSGALFAWKLDWYQLVNQ